MTVSRSFRPRFDALAELVAFTAAGFEDEGIDRRLLTVVDFALEELFTNIVKYGGSAADIHVELRAIPGGVEVCLTADDVADFDPTRAPPLDTTLPIEQRQPGGLGAAADAPVGGCYRVRIPRYAAAQPRYIPQNLGLSLATAAATAGGAFMLKIEFGPQGAVVIEGRLDAAQAPAAQAFLDGVRAAWCWTARRWNTCRAPAWACC